MHFFRSCFQAYIQRWLGQVSIQVISMVFGLILMSVSVNGIIVGIKLSFGLTA